MRSKMEYALKNNDYKLKNKDSLEEQFINYLKSKYENQEIDVANIDIIHERKSFYESFKDQK